MNKISAEIRTLIRLMRENIHEIPPELLGAKPQPAKWSKKEILGHLIDSALNNLRRFTEIPHLQGNYKVLPYAQDHLVAINQYQRQDSTELVLLWQSLNTQICRVLDLIPEAQFELPVDIGGEIKTFHFLAQDYLDHCKHHIAQIFDANTTFERIFTHFSPESALKALKNVPTEFVLLLRFGDFELEYYRPEGQDKQSPHNRDEAYVIASGQAGFWLEGERIEVKAGDFLFVKAWKAHQFVDFSADFATWVIFYGHHRTA
jgi:DinB superfamily/Cupin domain